jgi:DNA-binding transcriptional MerR regulator
MQSSGVELQKVAEFLGVTPATVHRWLKQYEEFVSPRIDPPRRGKPRILDQHTVSVLCYVETLRSTGVSPEVIVERLVEIRAGQWQDLPSPPPEVYSLQEEIPLIPADQAAGMAQRLAENVFLQQEVTRLTSALQAERDKVKLLETQVENLKTDQTGALVQLHSAQIELERSRAEIARLEGQLQQYGFGRDKPFNIGLIILMTAVIVAVLVVVLLVVVRLVL